MVYLLVFIGSAALLGVYISTRAVVKNHSLKSFVRSMKARSLSASQRGVTAPSHEIIMPPKPVRPLRKAVELQEMRTLVRDAERFLARQQCADAERCYIQALTIRPDALDVKVDLAKFYLDTERPIKAEALYIEILQERQDASCLANAGLACYKQKKFSEAYRFYQQAIERDETPDRLYALACTCVALRRYEEAADLLEKARVRFPRDVDLLHLLAECYENLNLSARVYETYKRLNVLQPYDESVKQKLRQLATV